MATIKPELKQILDKYGISTTDKQQLWDCHGTLVLYHKAYEIIAAKEKIVFDAPQVIEGNTKDKVVALLVTGRMGDRLEWSFGEASAANLKSAYPYAMAEKRAKDRVIAKLVGLAQYVYSEDEADEFKNAKPDATTQTENKFSPENKSLQAEIFTKIGMCKDEVEIMSVLDETRRDVESLPEEMSALIDQEFNNRIAAFRNGVTVMQTTKHRFAGVNDANNWLKKMKPVVTGFKSTKQLLEWQKNNQPFIEGLEALDAKKYADAETGKLPKERFTDALKAKYDELSNIELSQQPLAAE